MRLRTKIIASIVFSIIAGVGFALVVVLFTRQLSTANDRLDLAAQTLYRTSELNILTYDFLINPLARSEEQWANKYAELDSSLHSSKYNTKEQQMLATNLDKEMEMIKPIFEQIGKAVVDISMLKKDDPAIDLLGQKEKQLVGQILVHTQNMSSDSFQLRNLVSADLRNLRVQTTIVTIFGLGILLFFIVISSLFNQPLLKFIDAVGAFSRGDFSKELDTSRKDEIGDLARAFDRMAVSLKLVMRDQNKT